MKRFLPFVAGGLLILGPTFAPPVWAQPAAAEKPAAKQGQERWHVMLLQGKRAGYSRSQEVTEGDRVTTTSDMRMEIKRGIINFKLRMQSEFVETTDGKPVSMSMSQALGAAPTLTSSVFTADGIETTRTNGDQKTTTKRPLPPGPWLTPAAAERYTAAELAKGSKLITYKTLDPTEGEGVVTVTRRVLGNEEVEIFGRTVPAVKWEATIDAHPNIKQIEYVDAEGETLKSVIDMGGITIEQLAADKDLALSKLEAPELLNSTMVKTDRPIPDARTLQRGTFRVSVEKETLPDLPTVAGQVFTREGPKAGTVVSTADGTEPVAAADLAAVRAKHLESSSMLKADDPEIVALVKRAKVEGLPSAEAARKLREFVYGYIRKKDMSVGFASASEVARTKTGDCTEHAALLAAMLRAAGVPSRCASGLLYIEEFDDQRNVFGYHMWTQA
ncbi:MAG TPA: transglutaminase-like domain-containing protein, partial [Phycisphaerales bacterium]|nr:transglutaminase-like domain-containing protein [Phycisphaerales bacterium]